jgi:uncharacterized protein (TIGR00299 family) protein
VKVIVHEHEHEHEHEHDHEHDHRHYAEIEALIRARSSPAVAELALRIFALVANAEAKLHGVPVAEVAFHEVGAIDSIVDIVGAAAALAWLAPARVTATPPAAGHGTVKAAHGILPVPAPATVEIARASGMPLTGGGLARELLTPTGAAILAAIVDEWGAAPPMRATAVGYGAGDADFTDRANLLRAVVGEPVGAAAGAGMQELEVNLDDMSPELCEHVAERLFAAGAVDVWWTPVVMKKSRPAFVLGALVPDASLDDVVAVVFAETTTLGVRWHPVVRRALERRTEEIQTPYGAVPMKLGLDGGRVLNAAPEYQACKAIALEKGVPLKDVYSAAIAAWRSRR